MNNITLFSQYNKRSWCAILSICMIAFFSNQAISAEDIVLEDNTSYIHLDKSFYVTGEVIWYKLYLDKSFQGKEVTISCLVANQKGKVIGNMFYQTNGQMHINGYYKIPFDVESGMYTIQFSGVDQSTDQSTVLSEVAVPVYNDLKGMAPPTAPDSNSLEMVVEETASPLANNLNIVINIPKNNYQQREAVAGSISVTNAAGQAVAGNISIAVVDKELADGGIVQSTNISGSGEYKKDLYVTGTVSNLAGGSAENTVVGGFSATDAQIYYAKVNEEGKFRMKLPVFGGEKIIQFLGDPKTIENIGVNLEQSIAPNAAELPVNNTVAKYVALSKQRKKIFQHYAALESNLEITPTKAKVVKQKANQGWNIKEYEYFEYMYIFFKENLSPLRFEFKSDSTYAAKMYNPANQTSDKFFGGKPLFIIDNIATRDGDYVARMRMEDVAEVELFYRLKDLNKNYKIFGRNGVAKITTYERLNKLPVKESKNNFTIQGLQEAAAFPLFNPSDITESRQPFFRPQLYWNPDITTDGRGKANFNYFQTDDRSTFQIQVVFQGENGEMGYATKLYTVE